MSQIWLLCRQPSIYGYDWNILQDILQETWNA